MSPQNIADQLIQNRFQDEETDVERLLEPLIDLSQGSPTLILGYGGGQQSIRREMIPYFHVCGARATHEPLRALLVSGWVGTETTAIYTIARLLAGIEEWMRLLNGIEITAFPVANLEACREGILLTPKQELDGIHLWQNSSCTHVRVLEQELRRYPYDVIIVLREERNGLDIEVESWTDSLAHSRLLTDTFAHYNNASPLFIWGLNPKNPVFDRSFTPMPGTERQPAEIIVGLPGTMEKSDQANAAIGITLTILHALREGRAAGAI